jgi:alpha-methylacyl-CoA racemase
MLPPEQDYVLRNRRSVAADLKDAAQRDWVLELADRADVLLEGYRPGVAERLGIGPDLCLTRNPRLVYARMTGWGNEGPLAQAAGHDINYLALTGALDMIGRAGERPLAPLNLAGDYGGGSMFLVLGVVAALFERERSGRGQVVEAAMVDGISTLLAMYWTLTERRLWSLEHGTNITDGGSPFYDTYECADGRFVAVGAIEPQFYARLLEGLGLDSDAGALPSQHDTAAWPQLRERFAGIFRSRTRDEWTAVFAGLDACVTPVLRINEVAANEQIAARGTIRRVHGQLQPMPAPRFSRSEAPGITPPPPPGSQNDEVYADWMKPLTRG